MHSAWVASGARPAASAAAATASALRADRLQALDAHRLELRHFEDHLHRDQLPDLAGLPLLRRSANRILDYLAESEMELAGIRPGPLRRIRNLLQVRVRAGA
jgi:hypothetical protein